MCISYWNSAVEIFRVKTTAEQGVMPILSCKDPTKVYMGNTTVSHIGISKFQRFSIS